jgi:hypothetical protein
MEEKEVYSGSEIPFYVEIDPVESYSMDDYDFECAFYCNPTKVLRFSKLEMQKVRDNCYEAMVDTSRLGTGLVKCDITIMLPDTYAGDDWLRKTIWSGGTDVRIRRART